MASRQGVQLAWPPLSLEYDGRKVTVARSSPTPNSPRKLQYDGRHTRLRRVIAFGSPFYDLILRRRPQMMPRFYEGIQWRIEALEYE